MITLAFLVLSTAMTRAEEATPNAELLMFEHDGCPWCVMWDRDLGAIYPKTWEGKVAPLRKVDILAPLPEDLPDVVVERATPIFVLVVDGKEIGRIRGYPGEDFFWGLLGDMLQTAGITPPAPDQS